jgi:hypothetical protein
VRGTLNPQTIQEAHHSPESKANEAAAFFARVSKTLMKPTI